MSEDILLSVCCVAFNHERYIREALNSFLNQKTNFRYEIIVHDDASTDATYEICMEYVRAYPDIVRVMREAENTYSKGEKILFPFVSIARGKYLAYCEGDDFWCDENKLQAQIDILEKNPDYTACVHNTILRDEGKKKESDLNCTERNSCKMDLKRVLMWERKFCFHLSSMVFPKKLFSEIPAFYKCTKGFEDFPLALLLASQGPIYYLNEKMSVYRKFTIGSWSEQNQKNYDRLLEHYYSLIEMYEMVDKYTNYSCHKLVTRCIKEDARRIVNIKISNGLRVTNRERVGWLWWKMKGYCRAIGYKFGTIYRRICMYE